MYIRSFFSNVYQWTKRRVQVAVALLQPLRLVCIVFVSVYVQQVFLRRFIYSLCYHRLYPTKYKINTKHKFQVDTQKNTEKKTTNTNTKIHIEVGPHHLSINTPFHPKLYIFHTCKRKLYISIASPMMMIVITRTHSGWIKRCCLRVYRSML